MLKDPDATLDYKWDWAAWLDGDTITDATVTATTGITVDSIAHDATTVTVWASGGTDGSTYDLVCHVTTTGGREDDRTLSLRVTER